MVCFLQYIEFDLHTNVHRDIELDSISRIYTKLYQLQYSIVNILQDCVKILQDCVKILYSSFNRSFIILEILKLIFFIFWKNLIPFCIYFLHESTLS